MEQTNQMVSWDGINPSQAHPSENKSTALDNLSDQLAQLALTLQVADTPAELTLRTQVIELATQLPHSRYELGGALSHYSKLWKVNSAWPTVRKLIASALNVNTPTLQAYIAKSVQVSQIPNNIGEAFAYAFISVTWQKTLLPKVLEMMRLANGGPPEQASVDEAIEAVIRAADVPSQARETAVLYKVRSVAVGGRHLGGDVQRA